VEVMLAAAVFVMAHWGSTRFSSEPMSWLPSLVIRINARAVLQTYSTIPTACLWAVTLNPLRYSFLPTRRCGIRQRRTDLGKDSVLEFHHLRRAQR